MKSLLLCSLLLAGAALAAVGESDVNRLGQDLTPLGGERAGNAAATIPDWTGGIAAPPSGYRVGDHHADPFAADQPLFTVTAQNLSGHQAQLTAGHIALLQAYPTFKLVVYPSRRSAASAPSVYEATSKYAATARLTANGNGFSGAIGGVPFPLPQNGLEVLWNHLTRYRGLAAVRHIAQAAPLPNGIYTLVQYEDEFLF
ncbi:MAG TPA: DUF1329 domain-containing protein, partial [Opitutus sp.]|nr:DUF1329 domain-containing protein [Opitutus sp.]